MAVIGKLGGDYGKQRLVAMVALATMPFVSSVIIQGMNETNGELEQECIINSVIIQGMNE